MYDFAVNPAEYPFKDGALFIGENSEGEPLGIVTKKHAITVGSARTGKGVGVINTNLRTWKENVLVVDPKGESADISWKARAAMGQTVHVIDPFNTARKVPARFKASYNPLADLNVNGLSIAEDITDIADGCIMRSGDADDVKWDNGAMAVIAGLVAYVLDDFPSRDQTLITVREILEDQREGGLLDQAIEYMAQGHGGALGSLMRSAVAKATAKEGDYYLSNAEGHTRWIATDAMRRVLGSSSFSMRDLKYKDTSIFVALPFKYLPQQQHGRFLRLMVRCGISTMQELTPEGDQLAKRCLFLLDEFFSLGYMDEVITASGGLPSYGVHLWPFLQDIGQLYKLYGRDGAGTFFGNADLHQFFGNADQETLQLISAMIGVFNVDDLPDEPTLTRSPEHYENERRLAELKEEKAAIDGKWWLSDAQKWAKRADITDHSRIYTKSNIAWDHLDMNSYRERLSRFQTDASRMLGKPRLAPEQVAHLVRLEEGRPTAEKQIAFVRGGRPLICDISRYFEWHDIDYDWRDPFEFSLEDDTDVFLTDEEKAEMGFVSIFEAGCSGSPLEKAGYTDYRNAEPLFDKLFGDQRRK